MEQARKILMFAVGIILTIAFVGVGVTIFKKSQSTIGDATTKYDSLISSLNNDWSGYKEGTEITGSELVTLLSYIPEGYEITVKTKEDTTGITYTTTKPYIAPTETSKEYINPKAEFACTPKSNSNGIVNSLTFTQQ